MRKKLKEASKGRMSWLHLATYISLWVKINNTIQLLIWRHGSQPWEARARKVQGKLPWWCSSTVARATEGSQKIIAIWIKPKC